MAGSASTRCAITPSEQSPSLLHRLARIALWVGGVTIVVGVLSVLGIPVDDWISELFDKLSELPPWAIASGVVLQTIQTTLAALAWVGILRAALPRTTVPFRLVLACYAAAVSMNGFLPANIGTWVMLIMFTTLLAGATFTAMLSAIAVQKIPFSIFNMAVYLYLFLSISGSFSVKLGFLSDHTGLIVLIAIGAVFLLVLLARIFWQRLEKVREQLLAGGAILRTPRKAFVQVFIPELGSYLARLAIVGVFLGAYGIPATFHNIATVTASNSISNSVSATPGGVGVTQALNTTALRGEADAATATAYSVSQQLVTTAWNLIFAVIMVCWVFGWSGGRALVESSYEDAKVKSREIKEKRKKRRED